MKIAINGFGRIGKLIFRAFLEKKIKNVEILAINELGSIDSSYHLMQFDSVHGSLPIYAEPITPRYRLGGNGSFFRNPCSTS